MAQNSQVFQRVEKKYLLNQWQYDQLRDRMQSYMNEDQYGLHTICNIYYDTANDDLIRTSLEKPVYKEKFRIRSYGIPKADSKVFLEIKKKYNGVVFKRRASMSLTEAKDYFSAGKKPEGDAQILDEIDYFFALYHPIPKLYLAYDRIAFYGVEDSELRMTFDTKIRSRTDELLLEAGDRGTELMEQGTYLLEIKISEAMPMWMAHALSDLKIYPVSFSKYGSVYSNAVRESLAASTMTEKQRKSEDNTCLQVLLKQAI